jgi:hypothetical protein
MKRILPGLLLACCLSTPAPGHVLDQYLQVAKIGLAQDAVHVELRLIAGVHVADRVFAMIDVDRDGRISTEEEQSYARRVVQDLALEVDGRSIPLTLIRTHFPSRSEMHEGVSGIDLNLTALAPIGVTGAHQVYFRNSHLPELGVYLANALVPATNDIGITGQERDALQRELRINLQTTTENGYGRLQWLGVFIIGLVLVVLLLYRKRVWQLART